MFTLLVLAWLLFLILSGLRSTGIVASIGSGSKTYAEAYKRVTGNEYSGTGARRRRRFF